MGDNNARDKNFAGDQDSPNEPDPWSDEIPEVVVWPLTDVLDLHTVPPRDVKMVVLEWLEVARQQGWTVGRVIHGKGIGVQRSAVRKVLAEAPIVVSIMDGAEGSGGWGATLVRFAKDVKSHTR